MCYLHQTYLQKEELIKHFQTHESQIPSGLKRAYKKIEFVFQIPLEQELNQAITNDEQIVIEKNPQKSPIPNLQQTINRTNTNEEQIVIKMDPHLIQYQ